MKTETLNLFASSKVKETAKKPEKKIIQVELLEDKINRLNKLKDEIETATGAVKDRKEKAEQATAEFGATKDNTKTSPKLSLKEVSGKPIVVESKAERLADRIIDMFDMAASCKIQMVNLIKMYI